MTLHTADHFTSRWKVSRTRRVAISALALGIMVLTSQLSLAAPYGLLLWNKLGSETEVLNSAFGPNLGFYERPAGRMS